MNGFDLSTISNCYIGGTQASAIYKGNNLVWPTSQHDYSQDYFTIESLENSNIIKLKSSSSSFTRTLKYSTDKLNWTSVTSSSSNNGTTMATLNIGEKLYLRGTNTALATSMGNHTRFWASKKFKVYGNIHSLLDGWSQYFPTILSGSYTKYAFEQLFSECPVIDASNLVLPYAHIDEYMYDYMFNYATQLVYPPKELTPNIFNGTYRKKYNNYCCRYMFRECRALIKSPIIYDIGPLGSAETSPFANMFAGCGVISEVTCYFASPYSSDFNNWLPNAPATGTFTKLSSASWNTGASGIPSGWTVVNGSPAS